MTYAKSVLICLGFSFICQAAGPVVGSIKLAQGSSSVRRGNEVIPSREGAHLFAEDVLQTAADGRLAAILQDGTRISLGPNSELRIDRFVYEPGEGRLSMVLRLARGIASFLSGKIAQLAPDSVRVETPVGVVGLRGTHFAVLVEGN